MVSWLIGAPANEDSRGASVQRRLTDHIRTPLYRNGYSLILSAGLTSGLGFVYWVLAAHLYPPELVGLNSAALSSIMFLAGIAQFSLSSVLIRFIPRARRASLALTDGATVVTAGGGMLVALVFLLGIDAWAPSLGFLRDSPWLMVGFALSTATWGVFSLQEGILTGLRQATWVPVKNSLFSVSKLALLFVFATLALPYGIFASWMFSAAVAVIPLGLVIRHRLRSRLVEVDPAEPQLVQSHVIGYAVADYVASLFWLAATLLVPILVTEAAGPESNAYFYLSWTIASTIYLIVPSMGSSLIVESALDPVGLAANSKRALFQTARIVLPIVVVLVIIAPDILGLLGHRYADEGTTLLRLLVLSAVPNILNGLYLSIARAQRQVGIVVAVTAAQSVSVLALTYVLLDPLGITGVGIAWLISQTAVAAVLLVLSGRILHPRRQAPNL